MPGPVDRRQDIARPCAFCTWVENVPTRGAGWALAGAAVATPVPAAIAAAQAAAMTEGRARPLRGKRLMA
ncbi:hypothetical protein GCM10025883_13930 [Mobilicoccus caccae]|uniref:Uncharacterized protein n=1 Tax=Mobilicoccus caccae TaxID=1859295 RepID=A0ABQ6IRP4_9MICO|nr:hypothetical protein GCM10025883_13930 [Mobilicoccus caccae]